MSQPGLPRYAEISPPNGSPAINKLSAGSIHERAFDVCAHANHCVTAIGEKLLIRPFGMATYELGDHTVAGKGVAYTS
jgi:hypothetical protein